MRTLLSSSPRLLPVALTTLLIVALAGPAAAQMGTESVYRTPAAELTALVDAPVTPRASVSPDRSTLLLMDFPALESIADLSQPELRLAGIRINPRTNGPSRDRYYNALTLRSLADGSERDVSGLPEAAHLGNFEWSSDGRTVAFTHQTDAGIELWVLDVDSATARRLVGARVNDAYGSPFEWRDDATLVARLIPEERGAAPERSRVPTGPVIQQSAGREAQARTFQDLLQDAHDEDLFEHYLATQVTVVGLDGSIAPIGAAGMVVRAEPSPDGEFLLVESLHRPFSYLVPAYRFPRRIDVWAADGTGVKTIADLPLQDELPPGFDSVASGPRSISWRAGADATLYWTEAQDGGDGRRDAPIRDRLYILAAPFEEEARPVADLAVRFAGMVFSDGDVALMNGFWRRTRNLQTWLIHPDDPAFEPVLLEDRSYEDRYSDPGFPVTESSDRGQVLTLADDGRSIYLFGQGASPEGNRPFVDRLDLETRETTRLWRSEAPYYETPVALLEADGSRVLTSRESVTEPPNYFVRDLGSGELTQITEFPHPTPQLAEVHKELVHYEREDGVQLTGTLYLPPGYEEGDGPLPMLMWAYPIEFKDASFAGQVQDSPYEFARISYWGALPMLTQGWAVFDDPKMPIIGEGDEEPNDNFRGELVSGAAAAVKAMVDRGIADPDRIAIGGHSYGAFMTGNLLAHSDLFRAGIARSGAYNRTLTPFGFQSEERFFWDAPEVYFTMSPFMHAEKVNEPILMIHGMADNNSGTFPIQSERYFAALQGLGATARLVMLPHESHGYRARESILHMLWEESEFLNRYVKNAPPRDEMTDDDASVSAQR